MKLNIKTVTILGVVLIVAVSIYAYVLPAGYQLRADLDAYETRIAYRDDYTWHTTPLSTEVVEDICSKINIQTSSDQCNSNAVVYAPELFDEIKMYFKKLSKSEKTYEAVQAKLEKYLAYCEEPDPDGYYRCIYDLRGDGIYPIFVLFNKDNFYYEIIANIGGS